MEVTLREARELYEKHIQNPMPDTLDYGSALQEVIKKIGLRKTKSIIAKRRKREFMARNI